MGYGRKAFSAGSQQVDPELSREPRSLYVHIPFCRRRCRYCDFASTTYNPDLAAKVAQATCIELESQLFGSKRRLMTAFVGGGTPSILPHPLLKSLLAAVRRFLRDDAEFTVEANPDSLSQSTAAAMAEAGVNRLSIGVQSFVDDELKLLGRLHSAIQAQEAFQIAQKAGFHNVSADLIYGIPGQSLETWQESLRRAIDCGITHASCYCLSYPAGTAIAEDLKAGRIAEMDEQLQLDCYDCAIDTLAASGLRQYEISNFASPRHTCKHNITYWQNKPYFGVGPSAVRYVAGRRFTNVSDLTEYVKGINSTGDATASSEQLTGLEHMAETLMLMLRMRRGVNRHAFHRRFKIDPLDAFSAAIRRYEQLGMISITPASIRLARKGLFVSDSILADLLP